MNFPSLAEPFGITPEFKTQWIAKWESIKPSHGYYPRLIFLVNRQLNQEICYPHFVCFKFQGGDYDVAVLNDRYDHSSISAIDDQVREGNLTVDLTVQLPKSAVQKFVDDFIAERFHHHFWKNVFERKTVVVVLEAQ